jgi:hypothetical protein
MKLSSFGDRAAVDDTLRHFVTQSSDCQAIAIAIAIVCHCLPLLLARPPVFRLP